MLRHVVWLTAAPGQGSYLFRDLGAFRQVLRLSLRAMGTRDKPGSASTSSSSLGNLRDQTSSRAGTVATFGEQGSDVTYTITFAVMPLRIIWTCSPCAQRVTTEGKRNDATL